MPPLPEEVYTVRWHAVTLDDNGLTEGEFDFIVGNATPRSRTRPGVWLPLGAATTVAAVAIIGLAVWRRVRGRR